MHARMGAITCIPRDSLWITRSMSSGAMGQASNDGSYEALWFWLYVSILSISM